MLMSAVDLCGHIAGLFCFFFMLHLMGRPDVVLASRMPPQYTKDLYLVEAVAVEAIVTGGTQLCTPVLKRLGITGRLNNLIGSFLGVRLMIWGMPYTGAMMNPASSLASTFLWARFATSIPLFTMISVLVVYIGGPLLGAIGAGLIEGRLLTPVKSKTM